MKSIALKWLVAGWMIIFSISCSDKNDPAPRPDKNNLVDATLTGSRSAAELQFLIQLSGRDISATLFKYDVDIYKVVYTTPYKDSEINASGLVLLPKTSTPSGMISFHHGTIVQQTQAPSVQSQSSLDIISYAAMASMGFITVIPDMIGFGESQEVFHPYYVEEPTASAIIGQLLAARSLATEKQTVFNGKLFLAGYSQGGYATMAAHKALEEDPLEDFQLIASFPAAGGYDITSMQAYFFNLDTYPQPYYLAYIAHSYQTYYNYPTLLTDFFSEPYATNIPSLFDGIKSPGQINAGLTTDIDMLLNDDLLANPDTDVDYEYLRNAFAANSLVDWTPVLPLFLYHGDADATVPYENTVATYEKLIANGASADNLHLITLPGADHSTGIEPYIEDVIKKLQTLR